MKVIPFQKPAEESPSLKGFRIIKTTHMGLTHYMIQRKIFLIFWKTVCYRPPSSGQHYPLMFNEERFAMEFIKNICLEESKVEVAWKG